ncbi:MAG TPA: efflux RND transporter permease subunit, partial [Opitutales bacterium]|nr:efflux RND transporter permease subunit [Opitutales bacterium]
MFFSIPICALFTFTLLDLVGATINTMVLGGLALVFSRLIDNSVVVLENIYRHMEKGQSLREAAQTGCAEVSLPVLAASLTTAIVFFPVTLLYGVSQYLFSALALALVIALLASYLVAMSVVPLFCFKFVKPMHKDGYIEALALQTPLWSHRKLKSAALAFSRRFNHYFEKMLEAYDRYLTKALRSPCLTLLAILGLFIISLCFLPRLRMTYFPRTDPSQFVINMKAATGTRIELTEQWVEKVEDIIRRIVHKDDLNVIVSNIGTTPDFSAMYTNNTASHTAFIQASLKEGHTVGSFTYMDQVRHAIEQELPQLSIYCQSGGLVDAVINLGLPAPIDVQISGYDLDKVYDAAIHLAEKIGKLSTVGQVFIPQDMDAPALRVDIDRLYASEFGLTQQDVIENIITAL